jgi:hypothetical protein
MLQAVDPQTSVRIDVFRAYGAEVDRARTISLFGVALRMVAFEDLVARHARLCCDLLRHRPVAPKFARDFLRMAAFTPSATIEDVWQEHRKPDDPERFAETVVLLRAAIETGTDLLVQPVYSTDVDRVCPRCEPSPSFPLADAREVFAVLGYC